MMKISINHINDNMRYLNQTIEKRINDKFERLNKFRPLPVSVVKKLKEQFEVELTYNSNAIEGNSLTLKETYLVVNEGITIKGKPLKDHLEAKNHQEALDYIYDLIERGKKNSFSENLIHSLNQIVQQNIDKEWAGRYRNSGVIIGGAMHRPPDAIKVPSLMKSMIEWYSYNKKLHPIELASIIHHKITNIHPFLMVMDGLQDWL